MTLNEWIVYGETGVSSKTMWAAVGGTVNPGLGEDNMRFDVPLDPADFRSASVSTGNAISPKKHS